MHVVCLEARGQWIPMWVLKIEPGSSAKAASAPKPLSHLSSPAVPAVEKLRQKVC